MPNGLKRYYGYEYLHFLTCSCYHRQPWLASARRRDLFLEILEQVRQRYGFVVVGYGRNAGSHSSIDQRTGARNAVHSDAGVKAALREEGLG